MNDQQKLGIALKLLEEIYQGSSGELALALERADSDLFDVMALLKGI